VALPEEEWAEVVHPLLNDESEAVRLQVAIMLCAQGDRRVLPVLAELLESETFVIRHESHEILVAVTDQDFGYFSDGQPERRAAAMGLWRRWVAKFEDKAEMRFDQVRPWLEDGRPRDE
jgi:HEAT repeat protein